MKILKEVDVIRTKRRIRPLNILKWLEDQKSHTKIYWHDRGGRFTIGAIGRLHCIECNGPEDYELLFCRMDKNLSDNCPGLRYYGGGAFDNSSFSKEWDGFGAAKFVMPETEIISQDGEYFLCINRFKDDKNELAPIQDILEYEERDNIISKSPLNRTDLPDKDSWNKMVSASIEDIKKGDYKKIVLARKSLLEFKDMLNGFALVESLEELNSNCFIFAFQFDKKSMFLGASPERLFSSREGIVETEAIAGTRPRSDDKGHDMLLKEELVNSEKEKEEHSIVSDMIKSKLVKLCYSVAENDIPGILTLRYGHHLFTPFNGKLHPSSDDASILRELHPTPAVSGYPLESSMVKIREKEPFCRGWYSGFVGFKGYKDTEFAVAIRSGLMEGSTLNLYSGAGIVGLSKPEDEWAEIDSKLTSFLEIFKNEK